MVFFLGFIQLQNKEKLIFSNIASIDDVISQSMFVVCLLAEETVLSVTNQDGGLVSARILLSMVMVVIRIGMVSVHHGKH